MPDRIRSADTDDTGAEVPAGLPASDHDGAVMIGTEHGARYGTVGPVSKALAEGRKLRDLRGSARDCYGDAGAFVDRLRDEW